MHANAVTGNVLVCFDPALTDIPAILAAVRPSATKAVLRAATWYGDMRPNGGCDHSTHADDDISPGNYDQ